MKHLLLGTFLVLSLGMAAQDSATLLTAQDTLFINFDPAGRKFTQHPVAVGQTLYGISKYYGLAMKDLTLFNPTINEMSTLSLGTSLLIPIPNRSIHRFQSEKTKELTMIPILYQVQPGDNLFDIAHRKFKMDVADFKKSNGLNDDNLSPGQFLQLGWFNLAGINPTERVAVTGQPVFAESEKMETFYGKGEEGVRKEIHEHGMAEWNQDSQGRNDLFALHRSAPIGSVIAVENPMNNRIVYAKVIGRLPENLYENKVRVILSKKVGQFLGAVDTRFFVKMRYLPS